MMTSEMGVVRQTVERRGHYVTAHHEMGWAHLLHQGLGTAVEWQKNKMQAQQLE